MSYKGHADQRWGHVTYAQHGDDLMLLNLTELLELEPRPNAWLDLGAHHPTTISNTRLLYERGYRGVNVEANADLVKAFRDERPLDVNVNVGVHTTPGRYPFYMFGVKSGRNTFSKHEADTYAEGREIGETREVPCVTVNQIVLQYCEGQFPPLLLLDIEGLDYDVLASADFETLGYPDVICVETRAVASQVMTSMLASRGYFQYCRMGENNFYVRLGYRCAVYDAGGLDRHYPREF